MIKFRSNKRFSRNNSYKVGGGGGGSPPSTTAGKETKWEVRPGGMLVQKRETLENSHQQDSMISIKVSTTLSKSHQISLLPTSTFGELKILLSVLTKLEAEEQRLVYKGKEREDDEHLHMVGVRDKDKVLLLEDPAIKEKKKNNLLASGRIRVLMSPFRTITV